ncbi:MAG: hypothetical protein ACRYGA_17330 [Janthinobacterium lividum]
MTVSSSASVAVEGVATFDFVPSTADGRLDYSAVVAKPIRGAAIELLGADGAVLASGTTTDAGRYSLTVVSNKQVSVRVRAQAKSAGTATWDFAVRDNTASDAIYAIASATFSSGTSASLQRDVNAPSGWNGTDYDAVRPAGAFALLDTVYTNVMKVVAVAPTATFPVLNVFWSPANVGASGNRTLGQVGTTSFVESGNGDRSIYVLGRANIDTDEYDASVVSHEWGHYYQSAFSRDDSPGGVHGAADLLDRRLAFSEGWGNAWSGIALTRSTYTDSSGARQSLGYVLDLSTGPQTNRGWFRETSIQAVLWNLERLGGFGPIHTAMTGPFKTGLPVTSIHPFAAAYATATPSQSGTLAALLGEQAISGSLTQPWGDAESNAGGISLALPLYQRADAPVCVANQAGQGNTLGRFAYVRITLANSGNHRVVISGAGNTDPDFEVYQGRRVAGAYGSAAGSEDAVLGLAAGESVLVVYDANSTTSCFTVSIN